MWIFGGVCDSAYCQRELLSEAQGVLKEISNLEICMFGKMVTKTMNLET